MNDNDDDYNDDDNIIQALTWAFIFLIKKDRFQFQLTNSF